LSEKQIIIKKEGWIVPIVLSQENLQEPYNIICEEIGLENTVKIAKKIGGKRLYFPKFESLIMNFRDKSIYKEFDGKNYKELGIKYGLSETRVREIINKSLKLEVK